MKQLLKLMLVSLFTLGVTVGCTYDDSDIKKDISNLDNRVSDLEGQVRNLNANVVTLQALINASQSGKLITNVNEISNGYLITFSDGSSITLNHGKDGKDGTGNASLDFTLTVKELNGVYYWVTVQDGKTTYIYDESGDRVPVYRGNSGGADGSDGADGITPIMQVSNDGYWMVSYDNGKSFQYVHDVDGNKVYARGQNGHDGADGSTPVISVEMVDGHYVWVVIVDGKKTYIKDDKGNYIYVVSEGGSGEGQPGADGITPIFEIGYDGYWKVSYDGGKNYTNVLNEYGNPVKASAISGDSFISDIDVHEDYVVISCVNGVTVALERYKDFNIKFSSDACYFSKEVVHKKIKYTITNADYYTHVEVMERGNITAYVNPISNSTGEIYVSLTGDITDNTQLLVFLCNNHHTITKSLKCYLDGRVESVIPPDIIDEMEPWIHIYQGVNPPLVEGAYRIDPFVTVYCQDYGHGGYAAGTKVAPEDFRLFEQDMYNNTISFEGYEGSSHEEGLGAFISGHDNYFSIFFNTEGVSSGIKTKTALVISGEKVGDGIKDLEYAFVMVEKGSDPSHELMEEGVFRVFKDEDGLAENITWNYKAKTRSLGVDASPNGYLNVWSRYKE